jgi:hypothetical protein
MTPYTQEIVLDNDGKFYKRSTVTTVIQDANSALAAVRTKPVFAVSPAKLHAISNHFGVTNNSPSYITSYVDNKTEYTTSFSVFVPLKGYYLRGASLVRIITPETADDVVPAYDLSIVGTPYQESLKTDDLEIIDARTLSTPLCWSPPNLDVYLMLRFKSYKKMTQIESEGAPALFVMDKRTGMSYIPNLPNVYDRGGICTGDSFPLCYSTTANTKVQKDWDDLEGLVTDQLNNVFDSYCNNDLRNPVQDNKYVKFLANGETIDTLDNRPIAESDSSFYQPVTNSQIIDFTSWMTSIQAHQF